MNEQSKDYPFSAAGAAIINALQFDPEAKPEYELLSSGLVWSDEFTKDLSFDDQAQLRCLWAFRAAVIRGHDPQRHRYRYLWADMAVHFPNWPGLRPERQSTELGRTLQTLHLSAHREIERLSDRLRVPKTRGREQEETRTPE